MGKNENCNPRVEYREMLSYANVVTQDIEQLCLGDVCIMTADYYSCFPSHYSIPIFISLFILSPIRRSFCRGSPARSRGNEPMPLVVVTASVRCRQIEFVDGRSSQTSFGQNVQKVYSAFSIEV